MCCFAVRPLYIYACRHQTMGMDTWMAMDESKEASSRLGSSPASQPASPSLRPCRSPCAGVLRTACAGDRDGPRAGLTWVGDPDCISFVSCHRDSASPGSSSLRCAGVMRIAFHYSTESRFTRQDNNKSCEGLDHYSKHTA